MSNLDSENYEFILNTCHDTAKRAETRVGFPVVFSRLRWPIEPKFSQVCYFYIEVVVYEVWALDNTVYRKGPMALRGNAVIAKCYTNYRLLLKNHKLLLRISWNMSLDKIVPWNNSVSFILAIMCDMHCVYLEFSLEQGSIFLYFFFFLGGGECFLDTI